MNYPRDIWHRPTVTLLKNKAGQWVQALVRQRKETGPDGTRIKIIKYIQTLKGD